MAADILGAWSAALAVILLCTALLCLYRLPTVYARSCAHKTPWRHFWLVLGCAIFCLGRSWHEAYSTHAWITDSWSWTSSDWQAFGYRSVISTGVLMMAGAVSHEGCGHKGWLAVLTLGLAVGVGTYLIA